MTPVRLVGVLGAGIAEPALYEAGVELGQAIAGRGWWLICGGLGGIMEAACRGAREAGGHTVGILPGLSREDANLWVEIPIVTAMADARNTIIARSAHACIALPGSHGTLSEIAFCLKFGTPVVGFEPPGCGAVPHDGIARVVSAGQACDWVSSTL